MRSFLLYLLITSLAFANPVLDAINRVRKQVEEVERTLDSLNRTRESLERLGTDRTRNQQTAEPAEQEKIPQKPPEEGKSSTPSSARAEGCDEVVKNSAELMYLLNVYLHNASTFRDRELPDLSWKEKVVFCLDGFLGDLHYFPVNGSHYSHSRRDKRRTIIFRSRRSEPAVLMNFAIWIDSFSPIDLVFENLVLLGVFIRATMLTRVIIKDSFLYCKVFHPPGLRASSLRLGMREAVSDNGSTIIALLGGGAELRNNYFYSCYVSIKRSLSAKPFSVIVEDNVFEKSGLSVEEGKAFVSEYRIRNNLFYHGGVLMNIIGGAKERVDAYIEGNVFYTIPFEKTKKLHSNGIMLVVKFPSHYESRAFEYHIKNNIFSRDDWPANTHIIGVGYTPNGNLALWNASSVQSMKKENKHADIHLDGSCFSHARKLNNAETKYANIGPNNLWDRRFDIDAESMTYTGDQECLKRVPWFGPHVGQKVNWWRDYLLAKSREHNYQYVVVPHRK